MNRNESNPQSEALADQRRKEFEEMVRTIVRLPNGATYTTLKPSPGVGRWER